MSATGYLIDATTRHAIFVERYGHGRYNDLEPILNDMRDKLVARLSREDLTDFQFVRAQALLADVDDILAGSFQQFELDLGGYIEEFAEYEAGFNSRMLQGAVKVEVDIPAIEQVNAALNNTSMVLTQDNGAEQRLTIQQAIEQFSANKSQEVRSLIQQGLIGGETADDITRQVINSVERKINKTVKAQARSLVSTTISAASNQAHNQTARTNSDVLRGEQIIATLDSHTSDICISADKTIWPVDAGPFPPLHWACRSLRVMLVEPKYAIPGLEGTRASESGQVSANLSYRGWLKQQPKEVRDRVNIQKTYSLAELAALEPVTFL